MVEQVEGGDTEFSLLPFGNGKALMDCQVLVEVARATDVWQLPHAVVADIRCAQALKPDLLAVSKTGARIAGEDRKDHTLVGSVVRLGCERRASHVRQLQAEVLSGVVGRLQVSARLPRRDAGNRPSV